MSEECVTSAADVDILIRRVGTDDHIDIVKLFQTFDREKYNFDTSNGATYGNGNKASVISLAGLRIDERGGIYLNPLLDSNSAYFKCYVAEDTVSSSLIGYILFFNTLHHEDSSSAGAGGGHVGAIGDDPVAVVEDIFVKVNYRRRGIATQLWMCMLKASLERGCSSCECVLLPENDAGINFWRNRVGIHQIEMVLNQSSQRSHEVVLELDRNEMQRILNQLSAKSVAN